MRKSFNSKNKIRSTDSICLSKGRSLNFFIISKVRKLKRREEVIKKEKHFEKVEEIKEDHNKRYSKKTNNTKRLFIILAPEKNPRG